MEKVWAEATKWGCVKAAEMAAGMAQGNVQTVTVEVVVRAILLMTTTMAPAIILKTEQDTNNYVMAVGMEQVKPNNPSDF
jgi:hypothetical protein